MARLYVLNATGQNLVVNYRTDFSVDDVGNRTTERMRPYKSLEVKARKQVPFGGDMAIQHIHQIIRQIERTCGAVPTSEIRTAKAKGVVRMVYSVDKEVPLAVCKDVVQHNLVVLTDQGASRRRRLAVAASLNMSQLSDPTVSVHNTETEFESVGDTEDGDLASRSLAEGFTEKPAARGRSSRSRR